jgi:hypothetical protein
MEYKEVAISKLCEQFPGLEKEVRSTIYQLKEHGQVDVEADVVRIKRDDGGQYKVKDFGSYFS